MAKRREGLSERTGEAMDSSANPTGESKLRKPGLFSRAPKPIAAPPPPREPKKKRPRGFGFSQVSAFLSFLLVAVVVCIGGFVAVLVAERRPGPLTQEKVVLLTREDDDGPLADQLEKAGVIENAALFSVMTLLDGQRRALKRGEYKFPAEVSMMDVEEMLARHRVVKHKLTIPEGLTSEQIVDRLRADDMLSGDINETPREGSLYPDTYIYERGESRNAIIAHMAVEMKKVADAVWAKHAPDLPIRSSGEMVTLASIVEKETGKAGERPQVAGVFINRLQKHMKLQSDPTIVYGLVFGKGTLGHSITKAELQEATPYNTYFIDGLPPGPICNPGRAAMEAVANPARNHDLFFVADGTGGHAFAETLDQHQRNVAHWRQIEKDAKDAKDRLGPNVSPPPGNIHGEAPDMTGSRYGALTPEHSEDFGALAFAGSAPAASALAAKLARIAVSRRKVAELMGVGGSLSPKKLSEDAIDSLVVTGVNDPPPGSDDPDVPVSDDPPAASEGSVATAPLSAAALADLRARVARYGGGQVIDANASAAAAPAGPAIVGPVGPRRGFDASEGTKIDPLRNRTYDLNFAKSVPGDIK
jgi:UPF0755 protein